VEIASIPISSGGRRIPRGDSRALDGGKNPREDSRFRPQLSPPRHSLPHYVSYARASVRQSRVSRGLPAELSTLARNYSCILRCAHFGRNSTNVAAEPPARFRASGFAREREITAEASAVLKARYKFGTTRARALARRYEGEETAPAPICDCDNAKHNIAGNFIGGPSDGTRGKSCVKNNNETRNKGGNSTGRTAKWEESDGRSRELATGRGAGRRKRGERRQAREIESVSGSGRRR